MVTFPYVILGGGMVAGYAAQEMAANGLKAGDLAIISADDAPPYERPPLSKGFLAGKDEESSVFINDQAFYGEHGIELKLRTTVTGLDTGRKEVRLHTGETVGYEKLLIATGSRVLTFADFHTPGAELDGLRYLRSLDDAKRIKAAANGARSAVVVGGGFIGVEASSVLCELGLRVTMLFPEDRIWEKFFTPELSDWYRRYYEARGVEILPQQEIARFEGDRHLQAVALKSGRRIETDLALCGLGMAEHTELYKQAGIATDNGITVDEQLRTSVPGVWAAGDIANWRDVIFDTHRRLEHWDIAVEQGKLAGHNLLGAGESYRRVPYYFSDEFDLSFEYWGDQEGHDRVVYRGKLDDDKSVSVWWLKGDRLLAAFVMNRPDAERDLAQQWIEQKTPVPLAALQDGSKPLQEG